jgi:hypothetical protein
MESVRSFKNYLAVDMEMDVLEREQGMHFRWMSQMSSQMPSAKLN